MYRILMVDDEELIVNAVCSYIEENFDVELYRAFSAFEAMNILRKMRLDIVISDISMPGMDGLELLKFVKESWPRCHVILLTAYESFQYAYQSVKYDGVDYILKVESYGVIYQAVHKALQKLEDEQNKERLMINMGEHIRQMKPWMRKDVITRLLKYGEALPSQEEIELMELNLRPGWPTLLAVGMLDAAHYSATARYVAEICDPAALKMRQRKLRVQTCAVDYHLVWLVQTPDDASVETADAITIVRDALESLTETLEDHQNLPIMLTVTKGFVPFDCLKRRYDQAILCLDQDRDQSGVRILEEDAPPSADEAAITALTLDDANLLYEMLRAGGQDRFIQTLSERLRPLAAAADIAAALPLGTAACLSLLYSCFFYAYNEGGCIPDEARGVLNGALRIPGHVWLDQVAALFRELLRQWEDTRQCSSKRLITSIDAYISEHFQEDLHLTLIADTFHYSPSYLSRVYREATGVNLISAINDRRLEHAKKLLLTTTLTVNDVARASGFYSGKYFMQAFKRKTSLTPNQFRNNRG